MLTNLYADFDRGLLLQSDRVNIEALVPAGYWKNYWQMAVTVMKPYPAGGLKNQIQKADITDYTLQVYLGLASAPWTLLASQITWVKDEENSRFTAVLNLNTVALTTAIGSSAFIDCRIELRLIGDGEPRSIVRSCQIRRPVYTGSELDPEEYETPEALSENLALILDDSDTIDVQQSGNNFSFHVRRKAGGRIGAGAEGIYVEDAEPAADDFLDSLRLECDMAVSPNTVNATDEVSVTAGGDTDKVYLAQLRVRGFVENRTYTGGIPLGGKLYKDASAPGGSRNVWKLTIEEPFQEYYVNYDAVGESITVLDYLTPLIPIRGGAAVTLSYDTKDSQQTPVGLPVGITPPDVATSQLVQIDLAPLDSREQVVINWAATTKLWLQFPLQYLAVNGNTTFEANGFVNGESVIILKNVSGGPVTLTDLGTIAAFRNGPVPVRMETGEIAILRILSRTTSERVATWHTDGVETEYATATISASGNADVRMGYHCRMKELVVTAQGDYTDTPYVYKYSALITHRKAGDRLRVRAIMEGNAPTVEIRNATTGGTLLGTFTGANYAQDRFAEFVFNGTAWELDVDGTSDGDLSGHDFTRETVSAAAIDFNKATMQEWGTNANFTVSTVNRAGAGRGRMAVKKVTNTGGAPITITVSGDINQCGTMVTALAAGSTVIMSAASWGPDETDTYLAMKLVTG